MSYQQQRLLLQSSIPSSQQNNNNTNSTSTPNTNNNNNNTSSRHHYTNRNTTASPLLNDSSSNNSNNSEQPAHSHNNNQGLSTSSVVDDGEMDEDARDLEEFKIKGDSVIHGEITQFVYKYDLKQSQIARMAGVNQAYVSKFLRGEFNDLSENGKTLIYRWYLKLNKNPVMLQSLKLNSNSNGLPGEPVEPSVAKVIKIDSSTHATNTNTNRYSYVPELHVAPKRTRFSFKQEHLAILEKSFLDNPYPDPKKREELARQCNSIRNGCDLADRERVTEQIVTHWFQNKRKLTRKLNSDDLPNNTQQNEEFQAQHEMNGDSTSVEYDMDSSMNYQDFNNDEIQLAAYKAIMSRCMSATSPSNVRLHQPEISIEDRSSDS